VESVVVAIPAGLGISIYLEANFTSRLRELWMQGRDNIQQIDFFELI
jgi:hypothetical protein